MQQIYLTHYSTILECLKSTYQYHYAQEHEKRQHGLSLLDFHFETI